MKKGLSLFLSLAMAFALCIGAAGLLSVRTKAADVTFPVYLTVGQDTSGFMPTGLGLTDASYNDYFGGDAAAKVQEIIGAGELYINGTAFPKDSDAFASEGFSVNEQDIQVEGTGEEYLPAAAQAVTGAVPIGNTIVLSDEDNDGVADKIEYTCYSAIIVNKLTDNGDKTFTIERADIQDGKKPYDGDLFAAGNKIQIKEENFDKDIELGDMAAVYKNGSEWVAVKPFEANGILVDGEDHGSYNIDGTEYEDAMRFSRDNISISNRCGEFTNAQKYFGFNNNKEGMKVSLWIVPTDESCETTGAPIGFTSNENGKEFLNRAIAFAQEKMDGAKVSKDGSDIADGDEYILEEDAETVKQIIADAQKVADGEDQARSDVYDHEIYMLYLSLNGSGNDIGAKFAGYDYKGFQIRGQEASDDQGMMGPGGGNGQGQDQDKHAQSAPQTADAHSALVWIIAFLAAAICMVTIIAAYKKTDNR